MDSITLRAPATVANLSCGFDILGVCLEEPYDQIKISKNIEKKVIINIQNSPFSNIPREPSKNTGGLPAELIINDYNLEFGFEIDIKKGIPLCGGLGSSAATASGVVYGINQLLNNKINQNDMIRYALEGEKIASETPHADNIGPCILGGLVIVRDIITFDLIKIPLNNFFFAIVHPDIKIDTIRARKMVPKNISLRSAIKQWGNIAGLTYGFASNNREIISRSMVDSIVEPVRSKLIPEYENIKKTAMSLGAIGCSISGSGPSIFALCENKIKAKKVLYAMKNILEVNSIHFHSYISPVNNDGIKIV